MRAWEVDDELPRFVSLLRMATGPVTMPAEHCGVSMNLEELEELTDEQFFDADVQARCIVTCLDCGLIAWGWYH